MMKKKINYGTILYGAFALIIVLFFLFMPILYVDTDNDFYANGYRILVGSYLQVPSDIDPEVIETVTLLRTSSFNFCAILFPIGTFLFYRISLIPAHLDFPCAYWHSLNQFLHGSRIQQLSVHRFRVNITKFRIIFSSPAKIKRTPTINRLCIIWFHIPSTSFQFEPK